MSAWAAVSLHFQKMKPSDFFFFLQKKGSEIRTIIVAASQETGKGSKQHARVGGRDRLMLLTSRRRRQPTKRRLSCVYATVLPFFSADVHLRCRFTANNQVWHRRELHELPPGLQLIYSEAQSIEEQKDNAETVKPEPRFKALKVVSTECAGCLTNTY